MFLFESCKKSTILFGQSIGQQALISGISDVIVVKYPDGMYKSTPFLACFGSHAIMNRDMQIQIQINQKNIIKTKNKVNRHGYMKNVYMTQEQIEQMDLQFGKNKIKYLLNDFTIQGQLWLLKTTDKILISDFDGTLTVNDFGGLLGGVLDYQVVHPGYGQLMKQLQLKGIYLIWVTMRSLPFYKMSKQYIEKYLNVEGIMLMQPQQFLPAVKKQLFKKTGNIKANLIKTIANLFPRGVYPFVGGLGNRQNDAIAYMNVGMKEQNIYLVSTSSHVHRLSCSKFGLTYKKMAKNLPKHFCFHTHHYLTHHLHPNNLDHTNIQKESNLKEIAKIQNKENKQKSIIHHLGKKVNPQIYFQNNYIKDESQKTKF